MAGNGRRSTRKTDSPATSSNGVSGGYQLNWQSYSGNMVNNLAKLYSSKEFEKTTDISLFSSEGDCVPAHKIILMMGSSYFWNLLNKVANKSDKHQNGYVTIVLGNVKTAQVQHLVRFLYTGQVNLSSVKEVDDFKKTAKLYGIQNIVQNRGTSSTPEKRQTTTPKTGRNLLESLWPSSDEDSASEDSVGGNDIAEQSAPPEGAIEFVDDIVGGSSTKSKTKNDKNPNSSDTVNDSDDLDEQESEHDDEVDDPLSDLDNGSSKTKKRKIGTDKSSNLNNGRGASDEWTEIDPLSEKEMKENWRHRNIHRYSSYVIRTFYCVHGKRNCPAKLKIKRTNKGKEFYSKNSCKHANHKKSKARTGLTEGQKEFIAGLMKKGESDGKIIFLKFEDSGIEMPELKQVINWVHRQKKKC